MGLGWGGGLVVGGAFLQALSSVMHGTHGLGCADMPATVCRVPACVRPVLQVIGCIQASNTSLNAFRATCTNWRACADATMETLSPKALLPKDLIRLFPKLQVCAVASCTGCPACWAGRCGGQHMMCWCCWSWLLSELLFEALLTCLLMLCACFSRPAGPAAGVLPQRAQPGPVRAGQPPHAPDQLGVGRRHKQALGDQQVGTSALTAFNGGCTLPARSLWPSCPAWLPGSAPC